MSKMAKPSDASDGPVSPRIVLSKPTAEAAAKYNLQSMAEADADATDAAPNLATNWSSAAVRRERMSEQRKTGASVLQDSGRSRVMSWRERNQSIATISSMTSSATTTSSISSASSATSSIYSTASAPAALTRKDFSTRNRTRAVVLAWTRSRSARKQHRRRRKSTQSTWLASLEVAMQKRRTRSTKRPLLFGLESLAELRQSLARNWEHQLPAMKAADSPVWCQIATASRTAPHHSAFPALPRRVNALASSCSRR